MSLHLHDPVCDYSLSMATNTSRTAIRAMLGMDRKCGTFPSQGVFVFLQLCRDQINQKHVRNEQMKFPINYSKNHLSLVISNQCFYNYLSPFLFIWKLGDEVEKQAFNVEIQWQVRKLISAVLSLWYLVILSVSFFPPFLTVWK